MSRVSSFRRARRRRSVPANQARFRQYLVEPLEPRHMLFGGWQNQLLPEDVSGEDVTPNVTPLDALLVINQINLRTALNPTDVTLPVISVTPPPFVDVSGDGELTPLDALLVINYLNLHPSGSTDPTLTPLFATTTVGSGISTTTPQNSSPGSGVFPGSAQELKVNSTTNFVQDSSSIAVSYQGTVVVWESVAQDGSDWGIYGQRYSLSGLKQGDEFRVNTTTQSAQHAPRVDAWPDGRFVVTWEGLDQNGDSGWGIYARLYKADGSPASGELHLNQSTIGTQRFPSVAVLSDGSFAVAWEGRGVISGSTVEDQEIFVRKFSSQGVPLTAESRVNSATIGYQERAAIAALPEGGFAVAYSGYGPGDAAGVFLRRYSSLGSPLGNELLVNTAFTRGDQRHVALEVAPSGMILVSWSSTDQQSGWGVYGQLVNGLTGSLVGSQILVNQTLDGTQWHPSVTALTDGTFVVAWEGYSTRDDYGIFTRKFGADGRPTADEQLMNWYWRATQKNPVLASIGTSFVLAWDGLGPGDTEGIFSTGTNSIDQSPPTEPNPNQPPVNTVPVAQSLNEDQSLVFSAANGNQLAVGDSDVGSDTMTVTLSVSAGKLSLGSLAGLMFTQGTGTNSTLMIFSGTLTALNAALASVTFTPLSQSTETVTLTISTDDQGHNGSGGSKSDTDHVTINILAVNDPPSFVKGSSLAVLEDSTTITQNGWATQISTGPSNESNQAFLFLVDNNRPDLFSQQPAISPSGVLTFTPALNAFGSATVSVVLKDSGGVQRGGIDTSAAQTFVITVLPVNDAPSFTKGPDQTPGESSGAQTVPGWGMNLSAGPANESSQTLSFLVSNNQSSLFSVQPAISPEGTLTYTLAAGMHGTATVTVRIKDSGGTDNGGVDTSAPQTFEIATCDFAPDLRGWTVAESGGSAAGRGTVVGVNGMALMTEGDSFTVSLARSLVIPATPSSLFFDFDDLNFDLGSNQQIHDAFEVALLDDQGHSLVSTFATGRDAFFNVSEGLPAALASGVTLVGGRVTVNLANVPAGTTGHLVLRLLNNDDDVTTSVSICTVQLMTNSGTSVPLVANSQTVSLPSTQNLAAPSSSIPASSNAISSGVHSLSSGGNVPSNPATSTLSALPLIPLSALAAASGSITSQGTDFWLGFNANLHEGANGVTMTLFLTGDVATTGTVAVPGIGFSIPFVVNPGQVTSVELPAETEVRTISTVEHKGIHITSGEKITVYGLNRELATTDAFLGLPTSSLGKEYLNLTYKNDGYFLAFVAGTQMLVVGSQDNTSVTIAPGRYSLPTTDSIVSLRNDANVEKLGLRGGSDSSPFVLDASGNYGVTVTPPAQAYSGQYRFRLLDLAADSTPISLGSNVETNFSIGKETVAYRFVGTAGQKLLFDGQSAFANRATVRIVTPTGETLYSGETSQDSPFFTLPESNTYYVLVSGTTVGPNTVEFKLSDVATVPVLTLGATTSGLFANGSESFLYQFQGQAGQQLFFDSLTLSRGANIFLYAPNDIGVHGGNLADDAGPIHLPYTGTYRVLVAGAAPAGTTFGFRLLDVAAAPLISFDTVVSGQLTSGMDAAIYRLQAPVGTMIAVDGLATNATNLNLRVLDRNQVQLFSVQTNADNGPYYLESPSPYLAVIQGVGVPDSFSFRMSKLASASAVTTDLPFALDLPGNQLLAFALPVLAGHHYLYDSLSPFIDNLNGQIVDASGNLANFLSPSQDGFFTATTTGSYYLLVSNLQNSAAHFTAVLRDLSAAPLLSLGSETIVNFATGHETQAYRINGQAGQSLLFDALSADANLANVTLTGPAGTVFNFDAASDPTPLVLPVNGEYQLRFSGNTTAGNSTRFRLLNSDALPSLVFGGSNNIVGSPLHATAYRFSAAAAEHLTLHVTTATGTSGNWILSGPGGQVLSFRDYTQDIELDLPQAGTYLLEFTAEIGTLSFSAVKTGPSGIVPSGLESEQTLSITPGQTASYDFTLPAGTLFYFDSLPNANENLRVVLTGPGGQYLSETNDGSDLGPFLAQASGTYEISLMGYNSAQAGDVHFELFDLSSHATAIALGSVQSGTLVAPAVAQAFQFQANAGDRILFDSLTPGFPDCNYSLVSPSGLVLGSGNLSSDQTLPALTQSGTCYLILNSNQVPLDYQFQLINEANAPSYALGTTLTGTLPNGASTAVYTFSATAGQRLYYDGLDDDFDSVDAILLDPADQMVFFTNSDNDSGPFLIPVTGTYRLRISGNTASSADYSLRILEPAAASVVGVGSTISGDLGPLGRNTQLYQFTGSAGQTLIYDGLGTNFDNVRVTILDPTGRQLFLANADSDSNGLTLPLSGSYQLLLQGTSNANAPYGFRLLDTATASVLALNNTFSGVLPAGDEVALYQFTATAGHSLFYNGLNSDFPGSRLDIFDAHFNLLFSRNSIRDDGFLIPNGAGPYLVLVHGNQAGAINYSFTIQDSSAAPLVTLGSDVAGLLANGQTQLTYRIAATAGQRIFYDGLGTNDDNVTALLYSPSGNLIRTSNADRDMPILTLTETGDYQLVIAADLATPSDFAFRVLDVAAVPSITLGTTVSGHLGSGRYTDLYRVNATGPGTVTFSPQSLSAGAGTPTWDLIDPENRDFISLAATTQLVSRLLYQGEYVLAFAGNSISGAVDYSFSSVLSADVPLAPSGLSSLHDLNVPIHGQGSVSLTLPAGRLFYLDAIVSSFSIPTHTITLNAGDTYQVRDELGSNDLTGTVISADKPIAVFGSSQAAFIPESQGFADHLVEQLPPTSAWGKEFVTMPLATRHNGDTFRFLANTDGTTISINGTVVATIGRGEYFEKIISGPAHISSSQPILVAQYSNSSTFDGVTSDPFMIYIPPYEQFLANYTVATPATGFPTNYINLVAPGAAIGLIEVDGVVIDANQFTPISNTDFWGVQVPVATGTHTVASPLPLGAFIYGFGPFDSYGYAGGLSVAPVATASSIALSPPSSTQPINTSQTFFAAVTDLLGQAVAGVRVDFQVSGSNSSQGFAFTNDQGIAEFAYTGLIGGHDVVQASLGTLVDEAAIDWQTAANPPSITLLSPLVGSSVSAGQTIVATGLASADHPLANVVLVTVNGVPVDQLDSAGNFFVKLYVGVGENSYVFTVEDSLGATRSTTLTLQGVDSSAGEVDFASLADVSGSFRQTYARSSFNQDTGILYADLAVDNVGNYAADAPLYVGIANISDPTVQVLHPAGTSPSGIPYYDFSGLVTGGQLAPQGRTGYLSAMFLNPHHVQFSYRLVFFGKLNDPPTIGSIPKLEAHPNRTYRYQVLASDPDQDPLLFSLVSAPAGMTIDSQTGLVQWLPTANDLGSYDVTLRVADGRGGSVQQHFILEVSPTPPNRPPLFTSLPTVVSHVNASYVYPATAIDPDEDDLLIFDLATAPGGMVVDPQSGVITWTPTTFQQGNQLVTLRVTDNQGATALQTFTICVLAAVNRTVPTPLEIEHVSVNGNVSPVFTSSPPTLATVGQELHYPLSATDANGDLLTFDSPLGLPGMVIDPSSGLVTWTPTAEDLGTQTLVLRVNDHHGGVALQTLHLQVVPANSAPVFNTLATLSAHVGVPWRYQSGAQDAEGQSLTFSLQSAIPGMILVPATGEVDWTPTSAQQGRFTVTLLVTDSMGANATQTFDVDVSLPDSNLNPQFTSTPRDQIPLGRRWVYQPTAVDANGDPLTFSLDSATQTTTFDANSGRLSWTPTAANVTNQLVLKVVDGRGGIALQTIVVSVSTDDTNQSPRIISTSATTVLPHDRLFAYDLVATDPDFDPVAWRIVSAPLGASLDPQQGTLRWTASEEQLGTQNFVIEASDPHGASAVQRFSVNVECENLAPSIVSTAPTSAKVDRHYLYAVRAVDSEQDPIAFALSTAPAGMTIDNRGVIRWLPGAGQLGSHAVVVTVTDPDGAVGEQRFTVVVTQDVVNQGPVFTSRPGIRATLNETYSYQAQAFDPEGAPVTYSLISPPAGMTINPQTGLVSWTPNSSQAGAQLIKIAADDGTGGRGVQTFALLARANTAPTIQSTPIVTVMAGETYHYDVLAGDVDHDTLTYTLTAGPNGIGIDSLGRMVWQTGLADIGSHLVQVLVTDSHGGVVSQSFSLQVVPDSTAPQIVLSASSLRVAVGKDVVLSVQATDNVGVVSHQLLMDGEPLPLDLHGTSVVTLGQLGSHVFQAQAVDAAGNVSTTSLTIHAYDPADLDGPVVVIDSPTSDARISNLLDLIGTVSDSNLAFYEIQYGRADLVNVNDPQADDGDYLTIGHFTQNVFGGTLGRFDSTLLSNDSYVLRVVAEDLSGNRTARVVPISVQGNLKLGDFTQEFVDLNIPLMGSNLTVRRTYDTKRANVLGDFGFGWSLAVQDAQIRESVPVTAEEINGLFFAANSFQAGTRVYLTNPSGRREGFTFDPIPQFSWFGGGYWLPRFVPDPGVTDKLEVEPTPLTRSGSEFHLQFLGFPYNPARYQLTLLNGVRYQYNQFTGLEKVTDTSGNTLAFSAEGIVSSSGPSIVYHRDGLNRITQIDDPSGHSLTYQYDSQGNLISMTDQVGLKTQFGYLSSPAHYLSTIVDPQGNRALQAEYDAQFRLKGIVDALGNRLDQTIDVPNQVLKTRNAVGAVSTYVTDDRGNILSNTDPLGNTVTYTYDANDHPLTVTDARGYTTTYTYNSDGKVLSETDPKGQTYHYTYNPLGQVTQETDPQGHTLVKSYDDRGNLMTQVNADGSTIHFTYDSQGKNTSSTDERGQTTLVQYGSGPRPTAILNADGSVYRFESDALGRTIKQTDAAGNPTYFTYDAAGRMTTQTDPLGGVTTYLYQGALLKMTIDPLGRRRTFGYDANNRQISVTDAGGNVWQTEYNAANQVIATRDPLGRQTRYAYDSVGYLVSITDPLGNVSTRTYDPNYSLSTITDANGHSLHYVYDELGHPTQVIDGLGHATISTYDSVGNVTTEQDANGNQTSYVYNERGRAIVTVNALGLISHDTYDVKGKQLSHTNPIGETVSYSYDSRNRLTSQTAPDGGVTTYTYDLRGNRLTETDPLHRTTTNEYDANARLISKTAPDGGKTQYTYDAVGNNTSITDPSGNQTIFIYDNLDRLVRKIDPLNHSDFYTYDAVGNLIEQVDREGHDRKFVYDANDQPIQEVWVNGATVLHTIGMTYDAVGNLTSISDANGSYTFGYDAKDQLVTETHAATSFTPQIVFSATYDNNGNQLSLTDSFGVSVQSTFDGLSRLSRRSWTGGGIADSLVTLTYCDCGRLNGINTFSDLAATLPVSKATIERDPVGRVSKLQYFNAVNSVLAEYDYLYDLAGQVTQQIDHGVTANYHYDNKGQLTSTQRNGGAGNESHAYDVNGNRTDSAFVTGANNRLLSDGRYQYQYDATGNLASKTLIANGETTTYLYDSRNRLVQVQSLSSANVVLSTSQYTYDALDRRVATTVNGQTVGTVYQGDTPWADTTSTGTVKTRYLSGDHVDQLWARWNASEGTAWYLADNLGTMRDLINSSGNVIDHIDYDSFGNVTLETDPSHGDRFKFTGREFDSATGLYYYRARYYDPTVGRFLAEDPRGYAAKDANLYRYVNNSPQMGTDPYGWSIVELASAISTSAFQYESVNKEGYAKRHLYLKGPCLEWTEDVEVKTGGNDIVAADEANIVFDTLTEELIAKVITEIVEHQRDTSGVQQIDAVVDPPPIIYEGGYITRFGEAIFEWLTGTNESGEVTSRPGFRKKTVNDKWNEAPPGPTGGRLCTYCGDEVHNPPGGPNRRDWHIDHIDPWSKRIFPCDVDRGDVIDDSQDRTTLACPPCNLGKSDD